MRIPGHLYDRVKLLFGPYTPPSLARGDRANCFYRDREIVITGWSDAPISWPRGYAPAGRYARGTGLLIDEAMARAIRHESLQAVSYWWRVGKSTVAKWRKALGVTRTNNEGTNRLV